MKIAVIGLLAAFVAAGAQSGKVSAKDATNLYQLISQQNQTFPNPDRDYYGPNERHSVETQ
jgi:hypothetical protein